MDPARHVTCPKCGKQVRGTPLLGLLEQDVVHAGEDWETASRKIEDAVDRALRWGHAGVKVVHGHGATTGRSLIAPRAIALMKALRDRHGGIFTRDKNNPGAHIIWFNR